MPLRDLDVANPRSSATWHLLIQRNYSEVLMKFDIKTAPTVILWCGLGEFVGEELLIDNSQISTIIRVANSRLNDNVSACTLSYSQTPITLSYFVLR